MVSLSPHHVWLDQKRGAETVKNREKERARNETSDADATDNSTTDLDATLNATTGATKRRKRRKRRKHSAATTSTTPPATLGYIFSGTPGPLPGIYGAILSGGRN